MFIKTFGDTETRTVIPIWKPKYSAMHGSDGEYVVLVAQYKAVHAAPWIVIEFTKAKHLAGQRFCISREKLLKCPLDSNGAIPCYSVKMSQLSPWDTKSEVRATVREFGW